MNKLEQAARALLAHWDTPAWKYLKPTGDLMADLREALAEQDDGSVCGRCGGIVYDPVFKQAEQSQLADATLEPVGYLFNQSAVEGNGWVKQVNVFCSVDPTLVPLKGACDVRPVYTHPVRTKDLTDDEAQKLWNDTSSIVPMWAHHLHFARAVIAADREKNNV